MVDVRLSCQDGPNPILVVAVSQRLRGPLPSDGDSASNHASWLYAIGTAFFPGVRNEDLGPPFAEMVDGAWVEHYELGLQGFLEDAIH